MQLQKVTNEELLVALQIIVDAEVAKVIANEENMKLSKENICKIVYDNVMNG